LPIAAPKPLVTDEAFVLDASALLASIFDEAGGDRVAEVIGRSVISSVNLSEVVARLAGKGFADEAIDEILDRIDIATVDFDSGLAVSAGRLRRVTRPLGLSLGDRACLATGRRLQRIVLTADRAWVGLDLGVQIELIR